MRSSTALQIAPVVAPLGERVQAWLLKRARAGAAPATFSALEDAFEDDGAAELDHASRPFETVSEDGRRTYVASVIVEPRPLLRWPGGKAEHARHHLDKLPSRVGATGYREDFLGGGALFFLHYRDIRPAILSDLNHRLINTYAVVRDHVEALIEALGRYAYTAEQYYAIRDSFNEVPTAPAITRAAWMIYLNKTCFNGLYRENSYGGFNAPFGATSNGEPPTICDADNLRACSAALQGVELRCGDFEQTLHDVKPGEVVILDPPYFAASATSNFTSYTAKGFTGKKPATTQASLFDPAVLPEPPSDQERLAALLVRLDAIGADWALTNADTPESRAMYAGWDIQTVAIQRSISATTKPTKGKTVNAVEPGEKAKGTREKAAEIIVRNRRPTLAPVVDV